MNDETPSTPPPRVFDNPTTAQPARSGLPPPTDELAFGFPDTAPTLDTLVSASEAALPHAPLGAACTLVWLAYITLREVAQGAPASVDEWRATRRVLESAVRHLVLAQAQRIVQPSLSHTDVKRGALLHVLRRLSQLGQRGRQVEAEGEQDALKVWRVARQIDLAAQCLHDWTAEAGHVVSRDEVGALARELRFVYHELQPMTGKRSEN